MEVMDGSSPPFTDTIAEGMEESSASRQDVAMTGSSVATLNLENPATPLDSAEAALAEIGRIGRQSSTTGLVPKNRSEDLIQHDEDQRRMHLQAGERANYIPQNLPPEERESWNDRHQVKFTNDRLHPNYRSYFDRNRPHKDEVNQSPGTLKPSWRLSTEAPLQDEREAYKKLKLSSGPNARPYPHDNLLEVRRHAENFSEPPSLHDQNIGQPESADGGQLMVEDVRDGPQSQISELGDVGAVGQQDHLALTGGGLKDSERWGCEGLESPNRSQSSWTNRHHVTWCNERNTAEGAIEVGASHGAGKPLNPMLARSYFDRMRDPGHCRCEARDDVKAVRVLPHWRLRTDPLTGSDIGRRTIGSASNVSTSLEILKAPTRDLRHSSSGNDVREKQWNHRHDLVFKNEEVSRLDRCYFDRWREPKAALPPDGSVIRMKPTWSLGNQGGLSPDKTAELLLKASYSRSLPVGSWSSRHQRLFVNNIHTNAKAYFDRPREPEEMAGIKQRKKATDKTKLKTSNWSLQEHGGSVDLAKTLRTESAPTLAIADQQRKNPPAWFSGHGVIF